MHWWKVMPNMLRWLLTNGHFSLLIFLSTFHFKFKCLKIQMSFAASLKHRKELVVETWRHEWRNRRTSRLQMAGKMLRRSDPGKHPADLLWTVEFQNKIWYIWVTILPSGRSRWLDIGQVFFYALMGLVHKHAKNPRPMSIHFDRTSLLNKRCSIICLLCISKKHEHLYGLILNVTCLSLPQAWLVSLTEQ